MTRHRNMRVLGTRAEHRAAAHLQAQGLEILSRNVRTPFGEIDLIARDGVFVVFVEVKARQTARYGAPEESVDFRKQARLCRAATFWLARHYPEGPPPCRFDVVAILGDRIRWIPNAFIGDD